MSLAAGDRLGSYTVSALIGAGGMGEVYRAHDMSLRRDVALKVLQRSVVDNAARRSRLEHEAHVLACLNHPNIATIHGVAESADIVALVMELVDGVTLAERIRGGRLSASEAAGIAEQIAAALKAAHQKGIVHRDLKPANIKITSDGRVKILDFGLAKLLEPDDRMPTDAATAESMASTRSAWTSAAGRVAGTIAYMSPEQARGDDVDTRTDIWAFGCVLYEMVTGRRLFDGGNSADVLAQVLNGPIEFTRIPAGTPTAIVQAITGCLQRDVTRRLHDVADVGLILSGVLADSSDKTADARPFPLVWALRVIAPVVAVGAIGVPVAMRLTAAVDSGAAPPAHLSIPLAADDDLDIVTAGGVPVVAMSPGGDVIVYASRRGGTPRLYRRSLRDPIAAPIPATEGASNPFFSADGNWMAFSSGGSLRKMPASGGAPIAVTAKGISVGTWAPDDTIITGEFRYGAALERVPASGGSPHPLTKLDTNRGDVAHAFPEVLPDGKTVLFGVIPSAEIIAQSLETGVTKKVIDGVTARYVPTGHIIFTRGTSLWAAAFDAQKVEVRGSAVRLLEGIQAPPTVAANGTLVYLSGSPPLVQLVWVDQKGRAEPLDITPAEFTDVAISPDGRRIALSRGIPFRGGVDLWTVDHSLGNISRVTSDGFINAFPMWSRDGKSLIYSSTRDGVRNLFTRTADGAAPPTRLTNSPYQQSPWSWSHDGRMLVFQELRTPTQWAISALSQQNQSVLFEEARSTTSPTVSPNGRWIAYSSAGDIFVRTFPDPSKGRWQVSTARGGEPRWSRDSRWLFYRQGRAVYRVPIAPGSEFRPGKPELLFEADFIQSRGEKAWDVGADGRFLMKRPVPAQYTLNVVLNWFEELKAKVPTSRK